MPATATAAVTLTPRQTAVRFTLLADLFNTLVDHHRHPSEIAARISEAAADFDRNAHLRYRPIGAGADRTFETLHDCTTFLLERCGRIKSHFSEGIDYETFEPRKRRWWHR